MSKAMNLAVFFYINAGNCGSNASALADKLLAIIDARFAELREKEKGDHVGERTEMVGDGWEPRISPTDLREFCQSTRSDGGMDFYEKLGARLDKHYSEFIAGHRIAKGECKCSQQQSESRISSELSSTPVNTCARYGDGKSGGRKTEEAHAPTSDPSNTPSQSSSDFSGPSSSQERSQPQAQSLDARAEALFVKHPEWRPTDFDQTLHYIKGVGWRWVDVPGDVTGAFVDLSDRNAHLLAALLPKAIGRWWNRWGGGPGCPIPPSTLISAIALLESSEG